MELFYARLPTYRCGKLGDFEMRLCGRNVALKSALLIGLVTALAGCETTGQAGSASIPVQQAAATPAAIGDPIAAYATGAPRGATTVVQLPSGGQARVHVGPEYVSAAGDRCKRVILTDTTLRKTQVSAVCLTEKGWNTVVGL